MLRYSLTIAGNVEECRTEAEISCDGKLAAIVYEASDGWYTQVIENQFAQPSSDFDAAVNNAQQTLSHYINRWGENAPQNMTWGAFTLWLMMKDDGTAMGIRCKTPSGPDQR
jgi:hypothetical protein